MKSTLFRVTEFLCSKRFVGGFHLVLHCHCIIVVPSFFHSQAPLCMPHRLLLLMHLECIETVKTLRLLYQRDLPTLPFTLRQ